jgi:RES domain-containing protein
MAPSSLYRLVRAEKSTWEEVMHSGSGRFHEEDDPPTTYLADSPTTAFKEVAARAGVRLDPSGFSLWKATGLSLRLLLDLSTSDGRRQVGVTYDELTSAPPSSEGLACARSLRSKGLPGFIYSSVRNRPSGICVVLFLENVADRLEIHRADDKW